MSDPFIGEIRQVGFNFVPTGWAACDGAVLPIAQNTALFSLLGTAFGGDGKTTFALPDLRERMPLHAGQSAGPGLQQRFIGEAGGQAGVSLSAAQMPSHSHGLNATAVADQRGPARDVVLAAVPGGGMAYRSHSSSPATLMNEAMVDAQGSSQPHNNLPPVLVSMFIIALQGIYPPRS